MNTRNVLSALTATAALMLSTGSGVASALFTSDYANACARVNGNLYASKQDVAINGGAIAGGTAAQTWPAGAYCVYVTDPSGAALLGSGQFTHGGGEFSCLQLWSITTQSDATPGFADTPNLGNEYKVWVCGPDTPCAGPSQSGCKTDNFKVNASGCTPSLQFSSCPLDISQPCTGVNATCATVTYTEPTPTGGQGTVTVSCDPPSGSCFSPGTTEVKCVASDDCSLAECTFNVSVGDCPQCHLTCPTLQPVCTAAGDTTCSAPVPWIPPSCESAPGLTVICTTPNGDTVSGGENYPVGTTTVTCTAYDANNAPVTDVNGLPVSCSFDIVVNDCTAPSITCTDITQCNDASKCSAAVSFAPTVSDNCTSVADLQSSQVCNIVVSGAGTANEVLGDVVTTGHSFDVGTTTVKCTVTDAAQNATSCYFSVTVNDCEKPSISCPTVAPVCTDTCTANVSYTVTASDNCGTPNVVCVDGNGNPVSATGGAFPVGTTHVTCTATDSAQLQASCSFDVTVNFCQTPGGLTRGFWSNKNGQSKETAGQLCGLTGMNLWTYQKAGTVVAFDPLTSCVAPTAAQINAGKSALSSWLNGANANDMAYMLSAQMAATILNVQNGVTIGSKIVDIVGGVRTVSQEIIYANGLLANPIIGGTFNGQNGSLTVNASALRTEQERVKNIFDKLNNGGTFVFPICPLQ